MGALKKNKGIISAIIIFIIAIGIYKLFASNEIIINEGAAAQVIGADIMELNASIERVNLDPALFLSRAYRNLVDFSTPLPSQPIGRKNPFDAIGR